MNEALEPLILQENSMKHLDDILTWEEAFVLITKRVTDLRLPMFGYDSLDAVAYIMMKSLFEEKVGHKL